MNLKIKLIILVVILIIIGNYVMFENISIAATINSADLYSKGMFDNLLKLGDIKIECDFVVYKKDGVEYPAYCLDKDVQGVSGGNSYSVSISSLISNVMIWRVIVNGYPYKTAKELGCDNDNQAYLATKQAVYCIIYNRNPDSYTGVGQARRKVPKSLKNYSCKCKSFKCNQNIFKYFNKGRNYEMGN